MLTLMIFDTQNPHPKPQKSCFFSLILLKNIFFCIFLKEELQKSNQLYRIFPPDPQPWGLPWGDKHFSITYISLRQQTLGEVYTKKSGDLDWEQSNPGLEYFGAISRIPLGWHLLTLA